jgi:hypothetical protein
MGGVKKGQTIPYNKNTNLVKQAGFAGQHPPVTKVKTDGRIGSATPPSYLKGGLTVDNNKKVQPHHGAIGGAAPSHMGLSPKGGTWSPRVEKARKMAHPNPKPYANPLNSVRGPLKRVKPD